MMSMMGWNMGFLGMIFWIIILGLLIYGVFLLISRPFEKKQSDNSSLRLLKERFARGEIDEEEYRRKRSILEE